MVPYNASKTTDKKIKQKKKGEIKKQKLNIKRKKTISSKY